MLVILTAGVCLTSCNQSSNEAKTASADTSARPSPSAKRSFSMLPPFRTPVADQQSVQDIKDYSHSGTTRAVVYEYNDIEQYISCVYPNLIQNKKTPAGYHWAVGFYFVNKTDPAGKKVLAFYVVPTLTSDNVTAEGAHTQIYSFDSYCTNTDYYSPDPAMPSCLADTSRLASGNGGNAYDAGQLYP